MLILSIGLFSSQLDEMNYDAKHEVKSWIYSRRYFLFLVYWPIRNY